MNPGQRDGFLKAKQKIVEQMWDSRHLQEMSDTSSDLYKSGREVGIPDGILRELRSELHEFQGLYRDAQAISGGGGNGRTPGGP